MSQSPVIAKCANHLKRLAENQNANTLIPKKSLSSSEKTLLNHIKRKSPLRQSQQPKKKRLALMNLNSMRARPNFSRLSKKCLYHPPKDPPLSLLSSNLTQAQRILHLIKGSWAAAERKLLVVIVAQALRIEVRILNSLFEARLVEVRAWRWAEVHKSQRVRIILLWGQLAKPLEQIDLSMRNQRGRLSKRELRIQEEVMHWLESLMKSLDPVLKTNHLHMISSRIIRTSRILLSNWAQWRSLEGREPSQEQDLSSRVTADSFLRYLVEMTRWI